MKILAIDLGTKTGWAQRDASGSLRIGTWELPEKKKGANCCIIDPRLPLFRERLSAAYSHREFNVLVYEDVQFQRGRAQAHLWSAFRTVLWLFALDNQILTLCCPVKTLKKFGCGSGNGDKDAMAVAYLEKTGQSPSVLEHVTDDAIDAWHLLLWAEEALTKGKKSTP